MLTPLLTYLMADASGVRDYGDISLLYSWIAIMNIVFTYGFETGYFRFSNKPEVDRENLFQTAFGSLLVSSLGLVFLFSLFRVPINDFINLKGHPEYIVWCLCIIGLDTLAAIPFAKLRQQGRPKKYAFVKLSGIVVNILLTVLFLAILPKYVAGNAEGAIAKWYNSHSKVGYLLMANLMQALFVFLVLFAEWKNFRFKIDVALWRKLFAFSAPMIVIGLAGMVNEVMDRQMLAKFLPATVDAKKLVGIYSANYKLAIFITLFIQAFKMAAEPFFFNQAKEKDAPVLYARVMKWFVIVLALAFLFSGLFLDLWQYMIGKPYRRGLGIVPILLLANICLGIYYNLSVWYKLTDRMRMGLYITLIGATITFVGNYVFIPEWGMYAAAYTTLVCYAAMTVITYFMGQKYFPVPYPVKKIIAYLVVMLLLFFTKVGINALTDGLSLIPQLAIRIVSATVLMGIFLALIFAVEKKELKGMPFIGKYIR